MISQAQQRSKVPFPAFLGERVYMRVFKQSQGLPAAYRRWQPTVNAMLEGIETKGDIFLMVDQRSVNAGCTHRRPGAHVDGYWQGNMHGHSIEMTPGFDDQSDTPGFKKWRTAPAQSIILASDVEGCVAYEGEFFTRPNKGGDCSHFDLSRAVRKPMKAGYAWYGDTLQMLHESLPLPACSRTVVRLNVNLQ